MPLAMSGFSGCSARRLRTSSVSAWCVQQVNADPLSWLCLSSSAFEEGQKQRGGGPGGLRPRRGCGALGTALLGRARGRWPPLAASCPFCRRGCSSAASSPPRPPASASARHVCPAGKQAASSVPRSWGGVAGSKSPAWDGPPHASPCHTVGVRPPEGWPAPADGAARSPPPLPPAGPLLHGARVRVQACGVRVCGRVRMCADVCGRG